MHYFQVGDRVRRGCIQNVPLSIASQCFNNSDTCKTCDTGENCNSLIEFNECLSCNSTIDPHCVNDPGSSSSEICRDLNSKCATKIDKNGNTIRMCASNKTLVQDAKKFEVCEGAFCNHKLFPSERLQCYQCNGEDDCDLDSYQQSFKPEPCNIYAEYDQCFTYVGPSKINLKRSKNLI